MARQRGAALPAGQRVRPAAAAGLPGGPARRGPPPHGRHGRLAGGHARLAAGRTGRAGCSCGSHDRRPGALSNHGVRLGVECARWVWVESRLESAPKNCRFQLAITGVSLGGMCVYRWALGKLVAAWTPRIDGRVRPAPETGKRMCV